MQNVLGHEHSTTLISVDIKHLPRHSLKCSNEWNTLTMIHLQQQIEMQWMKYIPDIQLKGNHSNFGLLLICNLNGWLNQQIIGTNLLYHKDTEPLYHAFMYSLVSFLSGIYRLLENVVSIGRLTASNNQWRLLQCIHCSLHYMWRNVNVNINYVICNVCVLMTEI